MRQLGAVPNIDAADADYPAGKIRDDNSPTTVGTPVTEILYGDIIQFFHKMMRIAGLTYNDVAENENAGFQSIEALKAIVRTVTSTESEKGVIELATSAEVQGGTDSQRAVTPAGLSSRYASDVKHGLIELATLAEVITGTDSIRAVTPAGLAALTATLTRRGLIELATLSEALAGTNTERAITPYTLSNVNGGLITKTIDIGDWNMDTSTNKTISLASVGVSYSKIIGIEDILIRNDFDTLKVPLYVDNNYDGSEGNVFISSSNILLNRLTGGYFDTSDFDSVAYNRGWITLKLLP